MPRLLPYNSRSGAQLLVVGLLVFALAHLVAPCASPGAQASEVTLEQDERTTQQRVDSLVEEAFVHGYDEGDIASCVRKLRLAVDLHPDDGSLHVQLSKALLTIGDYEAGMAAADRALELTPLAGGAHYAKAQGLLLTGNSVEAQRLIHRAMANEDLEMRPSDRGALSLTLVSLLMRAGEFEAAARFLETQRPSLVNLHEQLSTTVEDIGGGWHAMGAYAHVLAELGHTERAERILARFAPLNETYIIERNGGQPTAMDLWNLAATGAGRIPNEDAIAFLERSYAGGFVLSWRYNVAQHPTLWPLRGSARYHELLRAMDADMSRQRTSLDES